MALKRSYWKKKRKSPKVSKLAKRKDKDLAEKYEVEMKYWRYKGLKGVYWHFFSEYIRKRDFYKYGTCITCDGGFNTWKDSQAGHYAPASNCGFALLFDERNVNAECAKCNHPVWSPGKLIPYRNNLVKRYGKKKIEKLDDDYFHKETTKEWTAKEYHKEILKLKRKIKRQDDKTNKQ